VTLLLKFLVFVLVISLLAFVWTAFRRRLKLAFKVTALVYAVGMLARLLQIGPDEQRLLEFALVTLAFAIFWLLVWAATRLISRRREATKV
jgi:hypothetical protein